MKFENTKVFNFEGALRGMRNPKESWDKSDSGYECFFNANNPCSKDCAHPQCHGHKDNYIIGANDLKLAQTLIKSGPEHRKFMRQIFVCVDITAPLYWWKEFDQYKISVTTNSTSTMHKMASKPITLDCFEIDDFDEDLEIEPKESEINEKMYSVSFGYTVGDMAKNIIEDLEKLRQKYLETKDKRYWKELIRWAPKSWLQTRTVTLNYENLLAMCSKGQRRFHKLNEWSGQDKPIAPNFINWARSLPYAQELIFLDELEEKKNEN